MPFGAGQIVYDDELAALVAAITPVEVTTTATIGAYQSGFTAGDIRAVTALDSGRLVTLELLVINTSSITSTTGNIADTTVFILNAAYRPSHEITFSWDSGTNYGGGTITTAGNIMLRTAFTTIAASAPIRMAATFIRN